MKVRAQITKKFRSMLTVLHLAWASEKGMVDSPDALEFNSVLNESNSVPSYQSLREPLNRPNFLKCMESTFVSYLEQIDGQSLIVTIKAHRTPPLNLSLLLERVSHSTQEESAWSLVLWVDSFLYHTSQSRQYGRGIGDETDARWYGSVFSSQIAKNLLLTVD